MQIELRDVTFRYDGLLAHERPVLRNVSLRIGPGESVGIVGPSGSGKTTLVLHFTGLLQPTRGQVLVNGVDLRSDEVDLVEIRRRIGIVFQFPELQLFEETVWEDVAFAPRNLGLPPDAVDERVSEALRRVGLDPERFAARNPHQLSEGERRRVAIAGVLAMTPEVLVLDEPTAGLDPSGVRTIERMLSDFCSGGRTVVVVSHQMDFIARSCRRIVALHQGQIVYDGDRRGFFEDEDFVRSIGLEMPRILIWWKEKRRSYPNLPSQIYSLDDLRRALSTLHTRP